MMKRSIQTGILLGFLVILCICGFWGSSVRAKANQGVETGNNHNMVVEEEPDPPTVEEMHLQPEDADPVVILTDSVIPDKPVYVGDVPLVMGEVFAGERPYLIGIDPGHLGYTGGEKKYFNTGAVSVYSETVEYEWALEVARCLKDELVGRGYDVYLVRDTNNQEEFPYDYGHRSAAINEVGCDIMLGIHWDSYDDPKVTGYHVIYQYKNDDSYELAERVSENYGKVVKGTIKRRSEPIGRDDLWELNAVTMPGIFVECGFASNLTEAKWLEDADNQKLMAYGIADGIDSYFEYLEEKQGKETKTETKND
ncbi:MAG: N-acetylmuramoyl-L-alanine amidase [Lachnospiraceae bacterium]|nr:N-acetylmuramoyl-L-alanine amidase [Lachnospiraceae bacterium]